MKRNYVFFLKKFPAYRILFDLLCQYLRILFDPRHNLYNNLLILPILIIYMFLNIINIFIKFLVENTFYQTCIFKVKIDELARFKIISFMETILICRTT